MRLPLEDVLHLLELDKGAEAPGPLFQEPKRRLSEDPAFRAQWTRYQALKALAIEAAASLPAGLLKEAQKACRRAGAADALARSTGDDAARAILLAQSTGREGGAAWKAALYLGALLALGWLAWQGPLWKSAPGGPVPAPAGGAPLVFEFEAASTPAPAAEEGDEPEPTLRPADRQAKRLLVKHLRWAAAKPAGPPTPEAAGQSGMEGPAPAPQHPSATATRTPVSPTPSATASLTPTAPATTAPSPMPSPSEGEAVVDFGQAPAGAQAGEGGFSLELVSALVQPSTGKRARVDLVLPGEGGVDLRVFSAQGSAVRKLADNAFSSGRHRFDWDGLDDKGRPAKPGTYYLRVMTRWSSRVESLEVR